MQHTWDGLGATSRYSRRHRFTFNQWKCSGAIFLLSILPWRSSSLQSSSANDIPVAPCLCFVQFFFSFFFFPFLIYFILICVGFYLQIKICKSAQCYIHDNVYVNPPRFPRESSFCIRRLIRKLVSAETDSFWFCSSAVMFRYGTQRRIFRSIAH